MDGARDASGFALLAVLGLLIAGTTAALLGGLDGSGGDLRDRAAAGTRGALDDLARLVAVRDALLAYSTIYPELYGPTGAGPGHLPCPDTDATFRLAGPNPPCGRGDTVEGRLPAHVTVGTLRAGIDVGAADGGGAAVRYRLATRVANNPARRPLACGPGSASAGGFADPDAVAELSLPGRGGAPPISLFLGARELDVAAARRVAAWIVARAALPPAPAGAEAAVPDALALVTRRVMPSADGGAALELVDGVPQARHWFALDGWSCRFDVRLDPRCRDGVEVCAWRIEPVARTAIGIVLEPEV